MLYANFYETNSAIIHVTDEPEHWERKIIDELVYVISPSLSKAVGPLRLGEYIAHGIEDGKKNAELIQREQQIKEFEIQPSFMI